MFNVSNYSAKLKYSNDLNTLVVGKTKDEMGSAAIEEFVGLKPKMCSTPVSTSSECKCCN